VSAKLTAPTSLPDCNNLREILAYWLRLRRVQKGWSQERLALECDLDRTYVSAVERLHWNVSLSNLDRFAQALGVPPWTLLMPPQIQDSVFADVRTAAEGP
jgi:transcriptional regulator with XRE-family HTH domain